MNLKRVSDIIDKYAGKRGGLISMLEEIQALCGYLPEEALRLAAEKTGQSLVDIYGVATFYRAFSLKPKGKHHISVCQGTACHIRGAAKVTEEFERQLGIRANETTADGEFSLETVNCLGACALGPITVADGRYFPNVSPEKVRSILKRAKAGIDAADPAHDELVFPIAAACPLCGASLMDKSRAVDGRESIALTASYDGRQGRIWLSSFYGSFASECEPDIPPQTIVEFFCPHCRKPLADSSACAVCDAPMMKMTVPDGGLVYACSRKGCKNHLLDLGNDETAGARNKAVAGKKTKTKAGPKKIARQTKSQTKTRVKSASRPAAAKKAAPKRQTRTESR